MISPIGNLRRFWSKVSVKFEVNENYEPCGSQFCEGCRTGGHCWRRYPCWDWKAGKKGTYQMFYTETSAVGAHRVAFFLGKGIDPKGKDVCHHCDNRSCNNPAHLFEGSRSDNMQDASKKGLTGPQLRPKNYPQGDKHGRSKLKEWQIPYIRALLENGISYDAVAQAYGVSKSAIERVGYNKAWTHV